jgi:hypothetical protein
MPSVRCHQHLRPLKVSGISHCLWVFEVLCWRSHRNITDTEDLSQDETLHGTRTPRHRGLRCRGTVNRLLVSRELARVLQPGQRTCPPQLTTQAAVKWSPCHIRHHMTHHTYASHAGPPLAVAHATAPPILNACLTYTRCIERGVTYPADMSAAVQPAVASVAADGAADWAAASSRPSAEHSSRYAPG